MGDFKIPPQGIEFGLRTNFYVLKNEEEPLNKRITITAGLGIIKKVLKFFMGNLGAVINDMKGLPIDPWRNKCSKI